MNTRSIFEARDADLHLSFAAMECAALCARELESRAETELAITRNGVIERFAPTNEPLKR